MNNDPHDLDELVLHVQKTDDADDRQLTRDLNDRIHSRTELHPNRLSSTTMRRCASCRASALLMKEQKIVDHRPAPAARRRSQPNRHRAGIQASHSQNT